MLFGWYTELSPVFWLSTPAQSFISSGIKLPSPAIVYWPKRFTIKQKCSISIKDGCIGEVLEKGSCNLSGYSSFMLSVGKQNKRQRKKMKEAEELRGQNLLL